jgi:hypothetical protein
MPLALRLAGCWVLWSAWCSLAGWGLSGVRGLGGPGHLALLPLLLVAVWLWLQATAPPQPRRFKLARWLRRWRRPLPGIWLLIAGLSLLGAVITNNPWSIDAASYRLPRLLYWWAAHHWYWIGTPDHRLDFSSCGYEWQALPILELTHSDRFLFLINFVPFLLMPGLVFQAFRSLGVSGRSAVRWMWLLPSGYCYAMQCGGLQNDGYGVNYLLVAIVLAQAGWLRGGTGFPPVTSKHAGASSSFQRRLLTWHSLPVIRRQWGTAPVWLAVIAASLLTGMKLSNLPLLLPLAILLGPALRRIRLLGWESPLVLAVALWCSFVPLAALALHNTGDWTGDPTDQWSVKPRNPAGAFAANVLLLANDAAQLPVMPGGGGVPGWVAALEQRAAPVFAWLSYSHGEFTGIHFGQMPYEAAAGLGFGLALYLAVLLGGALVVKPPPGSPGFRHRTLAQWVLFGAAWLAFGVYLAKLGSYESARIAAPYYPLLLASLLVGSRLAWLERKPFFHGLACVSALTVLPVIILTPARPLLPIHALARHGGPPALQKMVAQYQFWAGLRDDLAPVRAALPPDAVKLGYGGGFFDTSYGLWKPFGGRQFVELGLPLGSHLPPPAGLKYAVVTAEGLKLRYGMGLPEWLASTGGKVISTCQRDRRLDAHSAPEYEAWYIVEF